MRGTRACTGLTWATWRFIPACAGNTRRHPAASRETAVHPRVCGEHTLTSQHFPTPDGSSPRVRGTLRGGSAMTVQQRFIPACAGNTSRISIQNNRISVHPRVCGEHLGYHLASATTAGSSPRVRGTRHCKRIALSQSRFIPACAGNTGATSLAGSDDPVHPRVCGEHFVSEPSADAPSGSSPRVRGTHIPNWFRKVSDRFIPACAGNTSPARSPATGNSVHPRVCGEH